MRLLSIELQNYRCYKEFKVEFQPGFNVIAGVNGSGKTSLLKAIRDGLLSYTLSVGANPLALHELEMVRIQAAVSNSRYRFERVYPVKISMTAEAGGVLFDWTHEKTGETAYPITLGIHPSPLNGEMQMSNSRQAAAKEVLALPMLAYFPAYRQWATFKLQETTAATHQESRTAGYENWWDASASSPALQQWVITKSLERLQLANERVVDFEAVDDDDLAVTNMALSNVIENAKAIRYDFIQKSLMVDWVDGRPPVAFQNLSDGQRVAIALVADIARRMCLLNPQLGVNVARDTPGIVLIDELDIHLHPKWQRLLVKGLPAAFPNVQFIAASHSPQVLSELKPEEIILLQNDSANHPSTSYGLDSTRILEQIMDAEPRPTEVTESLTALFASIERNNLADARERLAKLALQAPGIPELAGAEALIKRKEVLGR